MISLSHSSPPLPDIFGLPTMRDRLLLIPDSYRRLTGRDLVAAGTDPLLALWSAPHAIVAHGKEDDPIFFFGNDVALRTFEMSAAQFTILPSRLSAEPNERQERQGLLDHVARDGFMTNYAGIRISASGRRFRIQGATVWNLVDAAGAVHGQAATFSESLDLD